MFKASVPKFTTQVKKEMAAGHSKGVFRENDDTCLLEYTYNAMAEDSV
jgi:hypothetical protein